MLDLSTVDLDEMATALQDQTAYDHRWLIDPDSGQPVLWTEDGGVDGRTPVDLDEVGSSSIDPLPSYVWYQDMADFAAGITDAGAGRSLARAIEGKSWSCGRRPRVSGLRLDRLASARDWGRCQRVACRAARMVIVLASMVSEIVAVRAAVGPAG